MIIKTENLSKTFVTHRKKPGLVGSVKSLFYREWIYKKALDSLYLEVQEGEILGLIGANGAGKTTLVKMLSGIMPPTLGDATVLGYRPWERSNDFLRQMALIMGQKAQLWWDLPAADSFALLKEIYSIDTRIYKKSLQYLIETLGVQEQIFTQVRRLSLGERMKMELIASLLHQPKVIFLDEPTIGLDLTSQMAIRKFLKEYRQEFKPAIILTSHYMEDIENLCERIVIIKEGCKIYDGSLSQIAQSANEQRTITFIFEESLYIDKSEFEQNALFGLEGLEIIDFQFPVLKIKSNKFLVTKIVLDLMSRYQIRDIDFLQDDISVIIESLIRSGKIQ